MSINLISLKCPACGQVLSIEEGREKVFCSYCGTPILVNNENEYTIKHIDEAEVKQAETEMLVKLQELENQKQEDAYNRQLRKVLTIIWLIISIALLAIIVSKLMDFNNKDELRVGMLLLIFVAVPIFISGSRIIFKVLPEKRNERIYIQEGGIRFPNIINPFSETKYTYVLEVLHHAGFTNITCINLHDLNTLTSLFQNGNIEKIEVNGKRIHSGGKFYMPDTPIVITYHGK